MQRLEVSGAVRHIYIYIYSVCVYVVRQQMVNALCDVTVPTVVKECSVKTRGITEHQPLKFSERTASPLGNNQTYNIGIQTSLIARWS
jgi:hypothetical protein